MSLAEAAIFEYAFKLGMQIAIETLIKKRTKSIRHRSCDGFFLSAVLRAFICIGIVKYLDLFIKMWYTNTAKPT